MEDMPNKKMPFPIYREITKRVGGLPLIETAICIKSKNALHYTQSINESFRKYAPYRRRDMVQKLIISPRNMPFNITG